MSLNAKELSSLLSVLSPESQKVHFDTILSNFHAAFPSKTDHIRVGLTLALLIQHNRRLFSPSDRIVAIYILYTLFKNETTLHPFSQLFVFLINVDAGSSLVSHCVTPSPHETWFTQRLIKGYAKEFAKKTPQFVLDSVIKDDEVSKDAEDFSTMFMMLAHFQSSLPTTAEIGIPCLFPCPEIGAGDDFPVDGAGFVADLANNVKVNQSLKPEFYRPFPPLFYDPTDLFYTPANDLLPQPRPHLDTSMCEPKNEILEFKKIFQRALTEYLPPQLQQKVLDELETGNHDLTSVGLNFTPAKLPGLVDYNPLIAITVLLKLSDSNQISEYFSTLTSMEMNLQSLEVINRLTALVELPGPFLNMYINNCISTCESMPDKFMQTRLVRLVCVFLQSLIRNDLVSIDEIFIVVQSFCINFGRIKEAAGLFRLLKQINSSTNATPQKDPPTST